MQQAVASALLLGLALSQTPARPAPQRGGAPPSEIYLASLSTRGATVTIGKPENISNAPGYDNQPFFSPDGRSLFFTSDRDPAAGDPQGQAASAAQTDIFRYDIASRTVTRVTRTPEGEYSPTVTPDRAHLSVIRVEADGTQRLWKFTIDGRDPSLVLPDIKPVGYHAWLDANTLALFVLGTPATLQVADVRSGTAQIVATDIGPSIVGMPDGGVSFVQLGGEGQARTATVMRVGMEDGKPAVRPLTPAITGARQVHLAWTPDGTLLTAHAGSLQAWRAGQDGWRAVAGLEALGLKEVTRLAVSPAGDRIALVAR